MDIQTLAATVGLTVGSSLLYISLRPKRSYAWWDVSQKKVIHDDISENVVKEIVQWIPNEKIGLVVGKKGKTIRELESSCKVQLKLGEVKKADEASLAATGLPQAVRLTSVRVSQLLCDEAKSRFVETIQVPSPSLPVIIGKGGVSISRIRSEADVYIDIEKNPSGTTEMSKVEIRGAYKCIRLACEQIADKVAIWRHIEERRKRKANHFLTKDNDELCEMDEGQQ